MRSRTVKRKECSTLVWRPAEKESVIRRAESTFDRQKTAVYVSAAGNMLTEYIHETCPQTQIGAPQAAFEQLACKQVSNLQSSYGQTVWAQTGYVQGGEASFAPLRPAGRRKFLLSGREKAARGFWERSEESEEQESFWSARQRLAAAWLKRRRDSGQVRRGQGKSRFQVQRRIKLGDVDWLAVVWGWVAALTVTLAVLIGAALYVAFTPGTVFLLSTYLFLNKVVSPFLGGFLAGIRNRGNVFSAGFLVGLGYGMAVVIFRLYGGLFSVFWVEAALSLLGSLGGGIAGAWLGMALFSASSAKDKEASPDADSVPAVLTNGVGIVKIHGNNG